MRKSWVKKAVVCGLIMLFIGTCIMPISYSKDRGANVISLNSGVSVELWDVDWKPNSDYALICGQSGTLLKYDDGLFTVIPTGTSDYLWDVEWYPTNTPEAFAVIAADNGIYRYDHITGTCSKIYSSSRDYHSVNWVIGTSIYYALFIAWNDGEVLKYDGVTITELCSGSNYLAGSEDIGSNTYQILVANYDPAVAKWSESEPCGTPSWNANYRCYGVDCHLTQTISAIAVGQTENQEDVVVGWCSGSSWTRLLTGYEGSYQYEVLFDVKFRPSDNSMFALITGNHGLLLEYELSHFYLKTTSTTADLFGVDWSNNGNVALIVGAGGTVLWYGDYSPYVPPVADAGGPYSGGVAEDIQFDASGSYDPDNLNDPNYPRGIYGYRWDWTNDGTWDTDWSVSPIGHHSYQGSETYIVKVQVKDKDERIANDTAQVTVIGDLYISTMVPIQTLYGVSLIREKYFAVETEIMNTFSTVKKVSIEISFNLGQSTIYDHGSDGAGIPLAPGRTTIFLPGGPFSYDDGQTWSGTWSKPFPFLVNWPANMITVKVDYDNHIIESNEDNNMYNYGVNGIVKTKEFKVVYCKIIPDRPTGYGAPTRYEETRTHNNQFIMATYPITETKFSGLHLMDYYVIADSFDKYIGVNELLGNLAMEGWLVGADRAIGIVDVNYFPYHNQDAFGLSRPEFFCGSALIQDTFWTVGAHELGHTYGLAPNTPEPHHHEVEVPGFWVKERKLINYSDDQGNNIHLGSCFMSARGVDPLSFHLLDHNQPEWICGECYLSLMNSLQQNTKSFPTRNNDKVVLIRGSVYANNTALLKNMWALENKSLMIPPEISSNYSIRFIDPYGQTLNEMPFKVQFEEPLNLSSFVFALPYPDDSKKVQIIHNESILTEKIVTSNPPMITVTYPNGNETLIAGNNYTITWDASDSDGDSLTYSVLYSPDLGNNWRPLVIDLNQTSYTWNTLSAPIGDDCLIQIIATDGINTGIDESNNTFALRRTKVYIDDDYNTSTPGWNITRYNTIQQGIDIVEENGIVFVYSGTYDASSTTISKSIQLIGEQRNTTIIQSGWNGITIDFTNNVSIGNFTIIGTGGEPAAGIFRYFSNNVTIRDCNISLFGDGIAGRSSYSKIINCTISNCVNNGITLIYNSFNDISACSISNCDRAGIYIYFNMTDDNIIRNCTFTGNEYGIYAFGSYDNLIYHNNFINNIHNAYESWGNTWDNEYPSGGNYWDDYTGYDNYHGPNQNLPGSDGIGDTQYPVYVGNKKDRYPLMEPWINTQHPPNVPNAPTPANETTNISQDVDLYWFCNDLDEDPLTYDVYFGTTYPPSKIVENQSSPTYDPGTLNYNTTYYWKIVAWDTHGASTAGSLWQFTTNLGNLHIKNLSLKWNFVSVPFNQSADKTELHIKFNGNGYSWQEAVNQNIVLGFIFAWNRTNQNYELTDTLVPGEGYWMYAYHDCELSARGVSGFESETYITDLLLKWNLIGSPNDEPVEKQDLMIRYNGMTYTWQEAVTNSIVIGFIFQWNETGQSYQLTDVLQPGKSYWMYAYYNCILLRPTI